MNATPGRLTEAHAHVGALGEWRSLPDLSDCAGLGECLETLARLGREPHAGDRDWVRCVGARVAGWPEQRWPSLEELDRACPNRACIVMSFDLHGACANSAALREASLRPGQRVGTNGLVAIDERTGAPTGLLVEDAAFRAWSAAPEPDAPTRRGFARLGCETLADLGYDEVHDLHTPAPLLASLLELERAGGLALRVACYAPWRELEDGSYPGVPEAGAGRVRLVGGKAFVDGTLNSRTALMLHPYDHPTPGAERGRAMLSEGELDRAIRACEARGLGLAAHAIGDGAVRMTLDAIERVRPRAATPRIEHAELIDASDVPRFVSLGVVCSVQACHLLADIEALRAHVSARLDRVLPLRELIEAGCEPGRLDGPGLVFGSDAPVVRADPEDSLRAATMRRRDGMDERDAIALDQRIDDETARRAFTGTLWP